MKQAIEFDLAGSAVTEANEIIHFTLQGKKSGSTRRLLQFSKEP